jgi:ABC-type multidrug transport system permease subunit
MKSVIAYFFMIGFQSNFLLFYLALYAVAMSSTAISVFLGCIVEEENTAKGLFPILTVPQMLFAGFFVSPDLIPPVIRWAQYHASLCFDSFRPGLLSHRI